MNTRNKFIMLLCTAVMFFSLSSCEKEDKITPEKDVTAPIVLDSYEVDFGTLTIPKTKSTEKEVIVTLTNKSNEVLSELKSSIEFPGKAGIKLTFSALKPGESIDVPFTFSPEGLEAGEYTGKATLTPSIGDPIEIELKATVVEEGEANALIVLDKYFVDFGTVEAENLKSTSKTEEEVILTLTNNSDQVLSSLKSSIEFPGNAAVKVTFSPLQPGESMQVPFTFSPASLTPGEYTGKATLIPSIGDPIEVELKATVVEPSTTPIVLSSYKVDFGTVEAENLKSTSKTEEEVVLTLTNNSDQVLSSLKSSIEFPGNVAVKITFSPLQPGESMQVPFTFSPASLTPGEYTGKATLIPSIGDPIEVELKATVVEPSTTPIVLSSYKVDFGTIKAENLKSTSKSEEKEVVLTLTNNSDQVLSSLKSSIEFPGNAAVKVTFSPLQPGESMQVPFTFSPASLTPGEYTGKATLVPSIGDPIEVELKATVVE